MTTPTTAQMMAEIERLKAENAKLATQAKASIKHGLKVSAKGALSLYGLGRFPITLYKSQWLALLDKGTDIRQFINDHATELKDKEEATAEKK